MALIAEGSVLQLRINHNGMKYEWEIIRDQIEIKDTASNLQIKLY